MIFYYLLIGMVWTAFFEWLLLNHSPTKEGLPTNRARLFHVTFWPLAIYIVIRNFINDED